MKDKFVAFWKMHGEHMSAQADTMEDLRVKVFGQAHAPQRNSVLFYQREADQ